MPARPWVTEQIERIEAAAALDAPADVLGRASAPLAEGARGRALRGEWLGHRLHPPLTDLPVGFWTSAAVLDLVGGRRFRPAAQRLIALGLICVPITAAAGAVDWRESAEDPAVRRVGVVHGIANSVAALLYLSSWRSRRRGAHLRGVAVGMLAGAAASFGGLLGGHMAFARGSGQGELGVHEEPEAAPAPAAVPVV